MTAFVAPERDGLHPVRCTSRKDGSVEWVTVEYAIQRVAGYYEMEPDDIRRDLMAGTPFMTISFIYRIEAAQ